MEPEPCGVKRSFEEAGSAAGEVAAPEMMAAVAAMAHTQQGGDVEARVRAQTQRAFLALAQYASQNPAEAAEQAQAAAEAVRRVTEEQAKRRKP